MEGAVMFGDRPSDGTAWGEKERLQTCTYD